MSSGSEQEMDGEAITAVFTTSPGPDCLKDVLPKLGQRLKVYNALKCLYEELQVHVGRFYYDIGHHSTSLWYH